MKKLSLAVSLVAAIATLVHPLLAQGPAGPPGSPGSPGTRAAPVLDSATLAGFRWRSIGPANMGGRISDIAGIPGPSRTFFVAAAAGGIWKTTNAGTTFRPVFDDQRVVSMGSLAIAPSDTMQIWAGTGEQNSRNSISPGGGIYKSTDGGLTWKLMGLERTETIGRIVVHPTNPDIVYVAALGHVWGSNPERGLYRTTDGGKSWKIVKFISDRAGFVDVAMDPRDPNTLYASSYERVRGPYFLKSGGPGSALWKTTDGGDSWTKVQGGGFPTTELGRIGIAVSRSNPDVVYALVEADSIRGAKAPYPAPLSDSGNTRAAQQNRLLNGLYRSDDAGRTWRWMNDRNVRPFYYSQVRVDPANPDRVYWSSTPVNFSDDGGRTVRNATIGIHVDHHAMWIDPSDPAHIIVGNDGGVSQTWDRGGNYTFLNVMALGQFYEVSYDMAVPYRVCGGLQDNGSWCGPSRRAGGPITNADWFTVGGGDGFYTAQDPDDPNTIYSESQGGNIGRVNYATGERTSIMKPNWRSVYVQYEDSVLIQRGDTSRPVSREVQRRLDQLRAGQRADSAALELRYNWNTPYFVSPHSSSTLYIGSNRVLKSTNRGDDVYPISPDLSTRDTAKIRVSTKTTGGITSDATGAETYGTITTLAESPMRPGMLYAGTDDGRVWLSRNDGGTWEDLTGHFPGVPANTYVVRIEPSHFDSTTFYVAFDNHRVNDFRPYLYVTTDYGRTFRPIANDLPSDGVDFLHVIREDPVNRDLLFVGTDVGAYVSLDRGAHWQRFMTGMPTVPVHDLKIHPRDHELIAATHGRSVMIVDIAPLEQMTDSVLAAGSWLFEPATAYGFGEPPAANTDQGQAWFEAPTPGSGAVISYRLAGGRRGDTVKVVITDVAGDTVTTLDGPATAGVHQVTWDLRGKPAPPAPLTPAGVRDSILAARNMDRVFDSLVTAGVAPKAELDRIRGSLAGGGGFGAFFRGGRGGGAAAGFQARPAESPPPRPQVARGAQAGAGAGRPAGGGAGPMNQEVMSEVFSALRSSGALQGGFGGGRGRSSMAQTGDYRVTLTVNGRSQSRTLRVERVSGGNGAAVSADLEELLEALREGKDP